MLHQNFFRFSFSVIGNFFQCTCRRRLLEQFSGSLQNKFYLKTRTSFLKRVKKEEFSELVNFSKRQAEHIFLITHKKTAKTCSDFQHSYSK